MAYIINDACTACGDCLPVCPNSATAEGYPAYRINSYLCTECVGFAEAPQCAEACPMDAVVAVCSPVPVWAAEGAWR